MIKCNMTLRTLTKTMARYTYDGKHGFAPVGDLYIYKSSFHESDPPQSLTITIKENNE